MKILHSVVTILALSFCAAFALLLFFKAVNIEILANQEKFSVVCAIVALICSMVLSKLNNHMDKIKKN